MTTPFAPFWMNPSAPGQLSNKRGSNTGADQLTVQVKYRNPRNAQDLAGSLRATWQRIASGGSPSSPQTIQDTSWVGGPTPSNLPYAPASSATIGSVEPTGVAQYGGRVYVVLGVTSAGNPGGPQILSAPITGGSVGTWRTERSIQLDFPTYATVVTSIVILPNGYMYAADQFYLYWVQIQADGTLGVWNQVTPPVSPGSGSMISGGTSSAGSFIWLFSNVASPTIYYSQINPTTGAPGPLVATSVLTNQRASSAIYYDPVGAKLYVIGGDNGATAYTTVLIASVTTTGKTRGALGAWAAGAQPIPLARTSFGFCVVGATPTASGTAFIFGGAAAPGGVGTNTIYRLAVNSIGASTWATDAQVCPTTMAHLVAWISGNHWTSGQGNQPYIVLAGNGANSVYEAQATGTPSVATAFSTGSGSLLVGSLGTNAVLTTNIDGSQDITFTYNAFGTTALITSGFSDGDWIQVSVQFTDASSGDPSPISYTVIKIGQPPSISGVVITSTDGRPLVTFNYNPGSGGDLQFSYRVQVAPNGFDSAVRYDGANSVQVLSAPYWVTAVLQTVTVTVVSRDTPMTGSSNSATSAPTTTPTLTGPGTPTTLTATPNNPLGLIALAWTNVAPAGTTPGNRIYHRRNGTSAWTLLFDSSVAITSFNAIDFLAAGVAYDFAVSQTDNANHSESVLSNIVLNKIIDPVAGGWSGFLHIQGQGTVHFAPLLVQGSPDIAAQFDTTATLPFQQLTPTVTLGVAHYVKLGIPVLIPNLANQKQVMDVLATAYLGGVLIYRDGFGAQATFQIDPEQTEVYMPPLARISQFKMTQIPNQAQPSTAQGSAAGHFQQLFNSIVPLDPSEAFL